MPEDGDEVTSDPTFTLSPYATSFDTVVLVLRN